MPKGGGRRTSGGGDGSDGGDAELKTGAKEEKI